MSEIDAHQAPAQKARGRSLRRLLGAQLVGRMTLPAYLVISVILANLPARLATGAHEVRAGLSMATYLPVAMLVDLRDLLFVYAATCLLVAVLVWGGMRLAARWRGTGPRPRYHLVLSRTAPLCTSVLFAVSLVAAVTAAQFRIERGLYPTRYDLEVGAGMTGLLDGVIGVLRLDPFLWPSVASTVAFGLVTWLTWRALPRARPFDHWREPVLLLVAVGISTAGFFGLHRAAPLVARSLPHWRAVGSPLAVLIGSSYESANVQVGAAALLRQLRLPVELRAQGAALLGLDPASAPRLVPGADGCSPHPLAQPFGPPTEPVAGGSEGGTYLGELDTALRMLSRSLLSEQQGPLQLWQLALESFRGDDLHALNADAPAEIAPVTNGLYEAARSGTRAVIAAPHMYGAGSRTSQGLSAMFCGLGTMPLGLAFGRDLGLLPVRCLPDILHDAGFDMAFYFGGGPDFDNMRVFFNYHAIDHIISKLDFQDEISQQGWDKPDQASDQVLFDRALRDSAAQASDRARYTLLLSLTNHFPFLLPDDAPPEIASRVARALDRAHDSLSRSDRGRIETFSYTDRVVGSFLDAVSSSPRGNRSIVVVSADHSTGHARAWRREAGPSLLRDKVAFARIPFLLVFPDQLVDNAHEPAAVRAQIARINELLSQHVVSQNDIPRILLALLDASPELASVPVAWRWHTIGGQRLSPYFRPPDPSAAVVGIDGRSRLVLGRDAPPSPLALDPIIRPTLDPELVAQHDPHLLPSAAFMSAFMQSYGDRCWQAANIHVEAD